MNRRQFLAALGLIGSGAWLARADATGARNQIRSKFAELQRRLGPGARLGIAAVDGSGRYLHHDAGSRYAMASTFKAPLAAAILQGAERGLWSMEDPLSFGPGDLVPYAPVIEAHLEAGRLSLDRLCAAIVEVSDNAAANLLLAKIGGPAALTTFFRNSGDPISRLDRIEPDLNSNLPGDPRDTTSPAAMAGLLRNLLFGQVLSPPSRTKLASWMERCATGRERLRAGFPAGWRVGDKTGTGANGAANDVAFAEHPDGRSIVLAVYMSGGDAPAEVRNQVHADIGRILAAWA